MPPPGVEPRHVTHPSTNRARRRVTSLKRPTPLPLRHAANQTDQTVNFTTGVKPQTNIAFAVHNNLHFVICIIIIKPEVQYKLLNKQSNNLCNYQRSYRNRFWYCSGPKQHRSGRGTFFVPEVEHAKCS